MDMEEREEKRKEHPLIDHDNVRSIAKCVLTERRQLSHLTHIAGCDGEYERGAELITTRRSTPSYCAEAYSRLCLIGQSDSQTVDG